MPKIDGQFLFTPPRPKKISKENKTKVIIKLTFMDSFLDPLLELFLDAHPPFDLHCFFEISIRTYKKIPLELKKKIVRFFSVSL